MPGDETTTDDDERTADADDPASDAGEATDDPISDADGTVDDPTSDADDGGFPVTRRKALVGGVGLLVGAGLGAGATFATSGRNQVEKVRPNSDGKGTLGELRWILEEKHGFALTSMVRDGDAVRVAYESRAQSRQQSRREIGAVISAYGLIVANDGPTEKLSAEIDRAFDDQATSYFVQASWVKQWRQGDLSDANVAQRVFNTRTFPKDSS